MSDPELIISFLLDGQPDTLQAPPRLSLLDALRERLGRSSLKGGCAPQGVCGCCLVLVNGKPRVSCTLAIKTVEGKEVETQASLSALEQASLAEAFERCGAAQCGYCTPGIALQSAALLRGEPEPSRESVARSLQMHLCRCTGWSQILDAVQEAGRLAQSGELARPSIAARRTLLGQRPYVDDLRRPGMLHGAPILASGPLEGEAPAGELRGPPIRPGLAIQGLRLGASAAEARAGLPTPRLAPGEETEPVLIFERSEGPACAGGVAVELNAGGQLPGFLEPECALAVPLDGGGLVIYAALEDPGAAEAELRAALGERPLRLVLLPAGGAYGGRRSAELALWAGRAALGSGRPVKVGLEMAESLLLQPRRPGLELRLRLDAERRLEAELHLRCDRATAERLAVELWEGLAGPYALSGRRMRLRWSPGPRAERLRGEGAELNAARELAIQRLALQLGMDGRQLRRAWLAFPEAGPLLEGEGPAALWMAPGPRREPGQMRLSLGPAPLLRLPLAESGGGAHPALAQALAALLGLEAEQVAVEACPGPAVELEAALALLPELVAALGEGEEAQVALPALSGPRELSAAAVELDEVGVLRALSISALGGEGLPAAHVEGQLRGGALLGLGLCLTEGGAQAGLDGKYVKLGAIKAQKMPPVQVQARGGKCSLDAAGLGPTVAALVVALCPEGRVVLPLKGTAAARALGAR